MRCPSASCRTLALLSLILMAALPAHAVRAPEPGTMLPELDLRLSRNARYQAVVALQHGVKQSELIAGPVAEPGPVRLGALAALEREAGAVEVRWDEITGSPVMLFARRGALTAPDARPVADIARDFVVAHRDLFLLDADEAKALRLQGVVPTSPGGGVARFEQAIGGIDVLHGHLAVSVAPDGRIFHVMGGRVTGAGALRSAVPQHDPSQALQVLAAMAGVEMTQVPAPVAASESDTTFRVKALRGDARVRRTIVPTLGGPRLAWMADLFVAGSPAGYELVVDDATLQPVSRASLTWFLDTRGRAFTNNPADGAHELLRFPDTEDFRRDESPLGWADETLAPRITVGNNVVAQDDIANDDDATPGGRGLATAPGPYWSFDFPFTGGGSADQQASVTALFYGVNWSHDKFYALGFDERSGNFQQDNLGRGGLGGDPVMADDMDGSGTNNANFSTPPDGFPGRMQMYLWDISGTERSSSFETGIVVHEFGHGVSTRLVGGPEDVSCLFGLQGGAMGEGWSDYFASSFLDDPVIAEWVSGDPAGIRMFRLDDNPPTGKDYRDFCTYANDQAPQLCEPHDNGEMWSGFLWLVRDHYIATYGAAEGRRRADQLVVDALKYTACSPSMLDARDALILADRLQTDGQNECEIKRIAASRYMGFNASSQGGNDGAPRGGNAQWPECVDSGVVRFDRESLEVGAARPSYACADNVTVVLTDGGYAPAADSIVVTVLRAAAEVDRELLSPVAGTGLGVFTASIPATDLAGAPADGQLNVQSGDVIEATYADAAPAGRISTTQADISCAPRLSLVRHRVVAGTCDADAVAGYPELPGFIDAGESADVDVEIANLLPLELAGTLTITTDRPDLVTVLPANPLPVRFPAAVGTSPASVVVPLKVVGSLTITPGDVANVFFRFAAPGFDGTLTAVTLPLELGLDYELESGLSVSYDMEGETAPVGPAWSTGQLNAGVGNQWTVVTCANTTPAGRKAFRNGPANCSGRYSDTQGNPYLASPALTLFDAATRAARITDVEWQNDINLGVIGFPPNIPLVLDADAVAVTVTNDPTTFDASDPITVATTALAFYIKVDIPGLYTQDSNTTGFVLDQRPVLDGQLSGVDLSRPSYLSWYFLPDITFVQPPFDAQGDGYYLDDVVVRYERVRAVASTATCTPGPTPYARLDLAEPVAGAACAGDRATVDASLSEFAQCAPGDSLEYRFLLRGAVVPCLQDDGVTPRVQAPDGWGSDPRCTGFPTEDTTYTVEVRCSLGPVPTDAASATVRIVDGLPVLSGGSRAFCAGSGSTILVDASASSLVGCPGVPEYSFSTPAGPVDCDGDGTPDGFRTDATCTVGPSDVDLDVTVSVRCSALPGCELTDTVTIPAISVTAAIAEASTPPGGYYCSGGTATLDASGSVVTGCTGGDPQYRFTSAAGFDSGWQGAPTLDVTVTQDDDYSVEVRCSLNPACVSAPAGLVSVLERTGAFSFQPFNDADDCAGDLFRLLGGVRDPPGVRCAGTMQYRFLQQIAGPAYVPLACFTDATGTVSRTADIDGWGDGADCWTPHLDGGGDFVIEYRCGDDPACVIETSLPRRIAPRTGIPSGVNAGTLRVVKTGGCPAGGDVRLNWVDTDYSPLTFLVYRSDDPQIDLAADAPHATVDDFVYTDAGVACDGAGGLYGTSTRVYFYLHVPRNSCTNQPIP